MIKVYKFRDINEAEHFLNGGIIGGDVLNSQQPGVSGLAGNTLTFSAPAGHVDFVAGANGDYLLFSEIKAQIETALGDTNIRVVAFGTRIGFIHPTAASAIALDSTDEIAKAILGFAKNKAAAGKKYGAVAGTPPALIEAYAPNDGSHVIFTVE